MEEKNPEFKFSIGGTRECEVQLWSRVYAVQYDAKAADKAVLELRKRL